MLRALVSIFVLAGAVQPALAGFKAVPAPIMGAGLPLLLAAAGVYVAVRLIRARRRD